MWIKGWWDLNEEKEDKEDEKEGRAAIARSL